MPYVAVLQMVSFELILDDWIEGRPSPSNEMLAAYDINPYIVGSRISDAYYDIDKAGNISVRHIIPLLQG